MDNGYSNDELPAERTLYELLNRQGYRRRTVAKSKVQKKRNDGSDIRQCAPD